MSRMFWISVVAVLAAGGAAGARWAFDEGHLGANPRAPTLENFKPVIDAWAWRKGELRPKCISVSTDSAPGIRRGRIGWIGGDVVGLGVTALALKVVPASEQLQRDKTLLKFDALAKEGFFKTSETTLELETGESMPAREYVLTRKGWENSYSSCFYAGRPEVLEIVSFARVQPDPDGIRAYEITYKTGVRALPRWADAEQGREIFGDLKPHRAVEEKRLRLLRTANGWLPEPLVKTKEGSLDRSRLTQTIDELLPLITADQILALGKEQEFLRDPRACILLPHHLGYSVDEIEWSLNGPVSLTMYEADATGNQVRRIRESWGVRMTNLARTGVFREETIPRDVQRNRPEGVKYVLGEKYLPYISKAGPGCLQLGSLKVELLPGTIELQGRQDGTLHYNFKAVGTIPEDSWARSVAWSGVPEVEAYLDFGVPITGSVEYKDGQWRIVHAGAAAPVIIEPPKRQPLLPMSDAVPGTPATVGSYRAGASPAVQPGPGSVHVFAVYQARGSGSGGKSEGTIRVDVGPKGRPVTLVLSSYEAVHWQIQPEPGAEIAKVVVMGYYPGRVSGVPQERVQRASGFLQDYNAGSGGRRRSHNPQTTAETVERLVGRRPDSVEGSYESHYFSLGSSRMPPPMPASPPPAWGGSAASQAIPQQMNVAPRAIGNVMVVPMPQQHEVVIIPRPIREPGR